jgi:YidC/Oxa1 family membrane protein insertase
MDIKKTILWAIFAISALMLYNNWLVHEGRPSLLGAPTPAGGNATTKSIDANNKSDLPPKVGTAVAPPNNGPATPAKDTNPSGLSVLEQMNGEKFVLENDVLRLEVSASGANVVNAKLLQEFNADNTPVELLQLNPTHQYIARSGLIAEGNLDLPNHNSVFKLQSSGKDGAGRPFLVLGAERNGVKLEKLFLLSAGSYVVEVGHSVTQANASAGPIILYTELVRDGSEKQESQFYSTFTGPAVYTQKDKFQKLSFADIDKGKQEIPKDVPAASPAWIAMVQHYFASAWIPADKTVRDIYAGKIDKNLFRVGMQIPLGTIAAGATVTEKTRLFVGPQEESMLEGIAPGLELLKDYGYLTILAKPIFWLLEKIHGVVSNWGWSIVLLTVLIKLVFFPLSAASYKSMARMKEVQPRLTTMREQYKGDPQKLNAAMMEMYKKEKINPLGGCLPVVVQIPVFIALYWVLLSSVEMRNAPWIGWIHDLSMPDPYFILPIIMAISMFVQTKLNPKPPDPIQAKVMMYMPLIFSVMFFFFPSGLVLYWVVNNLLSIAQQWQINKMFGKKPAA